MQLEVFYVCSERPTQTGLQNTSPRGIGYIDLSKRGYMGQLAFKIFQVTLKFTFSQVPDMFA